MHRLPQPAVGLTNFGGITRNTPIAGDPEPEAWHLSSGATPRRTSHPCWRCGLVRQRARAGDTRERRRHTTDEEWARRLLSLVRDDAGPAAEPVSTGRLELVGDNTYDLGHVPTWSRGRMVIIDAARAVAEFWPGASIALEDAVVLAQSLRDHADVPAAFAPTR